MKNHFTTVVLLIGFAATLRAQDDVSRDVVVRIACIEFPKDLRKLSSADGNVAIPLSVRSPSKPLKLSATNHRLHLYDPRKLPTEDKPAKPVVTVKIPASGKQFTVLLLPGKDDAVVYEGIAIAEDDFRYGGICMHNAIHVPILMTVDKKRQPVLKPSQPSIINFKLNGANRVVEVQFWAPKMKKFFYSAKWNLRSDIREIHILYLHPRTKRPALKTLVDVKSTEVSGE
ncbi:MAG: hypothetical protein HN759_10635 [Akkermansiaceae bacterium]|jgi:hypothetical protein|nr:hypothetical protein [Akkermansiaceae bacterium]